MAGYEHGIYGSEIPTSLVPPTNIDAGLPVVFGTAPIHLAADPAAVHTPVLCYSYAEAVERLGYSDDWESYTLSEVMKSQFALFNIAPVIFVNVLDPRKHKETSAIKEVQLSRGIVEVDAPVLLETLIVQAAQSGQPLVRNIDYTAGFNDEGKLVITVLPDSVLADAASIWIAYDKLSPKMVDKDDVIGGIDIVTGDSEGLELVNQIFPRLRLIPGLIAAPGWSNDPEVAAVMAAKTTNISGHFEAVCLADIPTDVVKKYSEAPEWKNRNNYMDARQIVCWPKVRLSDRQYHLSTQALGVICKTDANHGDIPYHSPSNQSIQANAAVLADGKEIFLATDSAAYLNGQGIVTAINFIGGWKLWGNRTAVYPSSTDVKDAFISIRRMFNWVNNTLITTFWSKIDDPANKRLIETIVDSANIWLNGLTARQFLIGASVEFRQDENPTTDLMDGILRFHVLLTPPSPARKIEFIQEYYPNFLNGLFE